jgi:signal transduction histidine kinase
MSAKCQKRSINQINTYAIIFAGVFAFIAAFIIIFNEYLYFDKEVSKIEKNYKNQEKSQIIQETRRLQKIIEYNYDKYTHDINQNIVDMSANILNTDNKMINDFIFDYDKTRLFSSNHTIFNNKIKAKIFSTLKQGRTLLDYKENKKEYMIYIKSFKPLGIVYGSSININDIQKVIEKKREIYKDKISNFILKIVLLTLVLYIISILKYRYFTEKISKELKFITDSFVRSSSTYQAIDLKKIELKEFSQIALYANKMIGKIRVKNKELVSLNFHLENLVEEKTNELKKSIEYTKELLEYQDKFVKNAIHEINTPLSIILINIELYNLKFDKNHYLTKIEAAVKILENIYGDLGYVVKKDNLIYRREMIDFTEFLKDRIDYFEDVAKGNDLRIEADIQDRVFVFFSETQLQRLCDNNISNAIKYSYTNEVIYVKLYKDKNKIVFKISNKGDEIKDSNKLFERFYREDKARGGFGLGLNIVKGICDTNHVDIEVVSVANITTFKYTINGELY